MYSSYKRIFNCHCRPQGCYTLRSKVMHCNVKGATLSFLQSPGTQLQLLQEAAALYLCICICLNTGALLPLRLVSLQLCGAALSPTVSTFHPFTGTVLVDPIRKGFSCTQISRVFLTPFNQIKWPYRHYFLLPVSETSRFQTSERLLSSTTTFETCWIV